MLPRAPQHSLERVTGYIAYQTRFNRNPLTLENGDALLTESGDPFFLER